MAKDNREPPTGDAPDPNARHTTPPDDRAKAAKWFARAKELQEKHNFDYAIKCYVDGLELWPEAVEDAHKPLRYCSLARRASGGKKLGMLDAAKAPMMGKDPVKAMLNAEWRLAHDPGNLDCMEGLLKNAGKARCDDTIMWAGPVYSEAAETEKKPSAKRFQFLKEVYEELGDRAQARGETSLAVDAYERAIKAMSFQRTLAPDDNQLPVVLRDLSTKLTIIKGRYQTGDSFRDSIRDAEQQAEIHDRDRMVQSEDRLDALIAKAEQDYADNPDVTGKVFTLVDLLCRRDNPKEEQRAITVLLGEYKRTDDYKYKARADDIAIRQWERQVRAAKAGSDADALKAARVDQLRFELTTFKERSEKYPTDQRVKLAYGEKLYRAGRVDEAIPMLQAARNDPKNRTRCGLILGRCFFDKGYFAQAIDTVREAQGLLEVRDDDLGKELTYWLGRSEEAAGQADAARKTYGQLLQLDYNYRDVRDRLDGLMK